MNKDTIRHAAFAIALLASYGSLLHAQGGTWTWMKGSQAIGQSAVWGTMGVAAAGNTPPSLLQPYTWTAQDGTFWLYGGRDGSGHSYSALWKYDPVTNQWTWIKGPATWNNAGTFGTQGVPAASNQPPSKAFGASAWTDLDGNFWMYGGVNGDPFDPPPNNDLWKYDITTNMWTWMKGSATDNPPPVWGTKGLPDPTNQPPAHSNCYSTWTDDNNDLWIFGGFNTLAPGWGQYNAMWRYTIATNEWTWIAGDSIVSAPAVYGTLGVPAAANTPNGRYARNFGKADDGSLWMYAGTTGGGPNSIYADLWRFDPVVGQWTWMGGSQGTFQNPAPVFGSQCATTATNNPGRRVGVNWQGTDGRWWVFGNFYSSTDPSSNDLWTYCPATGEWTWAAGPNTLNDPGSWGTIGVPNASNRPKGRDFCATWTAQNGDLYLFGGKDDENGGFDIHNDVWRFTPDANCGACSGITAVTEAPREGLQHLGYGRDIELVLPNGTWVVRVYDATGRLLGEQRASDRVRPSCLASANAGLALITVTNDRGVKYTAKTLLGNE